MEKQSGKIEHPVSNVRWVPREELTANDYNPNKVAPPELRLLKISIHENGWTQPIVVNADMSIVDGFHRWTVSGHPEINELTGGLVPVVVLAPTDLAGRKMATIRHNRARGTHGVLPMSNIVRSMIVDENLSAEEVMERLQMEREEVVRLMFDAGIPQSQIFKDRELSRSWTPKK
jgi:ParB-like chromosome segregation protein Spo0J